MDNTQSIQKHQMNVKNYTLLKVKGKGAYGTVFKAISNSSQKVVAIKYVKLDNESDDQVRSVCRELKLLANLRKLAKNSFTIKLIDCFLPADANA